MPDKQATLIKRIHNSALLSTAQTDIISWLSYEPVPLRQIVFALNYSITNNGLAPATYEPEAVLRGFEIEVMYRDGRVCYRRNFFQALNENPFIVGLRNVGPAWDALDTIANGATENYAFMAIIPFWDNSYLRPNDFNIMPSEIISIQVRRTIPLADAGGQDMDMSLINLEVFIEQRKGCNEVIGIRRSFDRMSSDKLNEEVQEGYLQLVLTDTHDPNTLNGGAHNVSTEFDGKLLSDSFPLANLGLMYLYSNFQDTVGFTTYFMSMINPAIPMYAQHQSDDHSLPEIPMGRWAAKWLAPALPADFTYLTVHVLPNDIAGLPGRFPKLANMSASDLLKTIHIPRASKMRLAVTKRQHLLPWRIMDTTEIAAQDAASSNLQKKLSDSIVAKNKLT